MPGSRRCASAGSIVSSNTSTLPLARLTEGLPESFARDFLITHFFNPPRYMRLLEIVQGPKTRPEAVAAIAAFADRAARQERGHVPRTRPGFIANRIGSYWMQAAFAAAFEMGLPVEEADAVLGRPLGIPKTGVFGLADLVGIDLLPHVAASLRAALPPDDPFHEVDREWPLIAPPDRDRLHRAQGQGRLLPPEQGGRRSGSRRRSTSRPASITSAAKPRLECVDAAKDGGPRALLESDERAARYAWRVMSRTLAYACSLVPEIADDIAAVDARDAPRLQLEMGAVRADRPDRPGLVPRPPRGRRRRGAAAARAGRRRQLLPGRGRAGCST